MTTDSVLPMSRGRQLLHTSLASGSVLTLEQMVALDAAGFLLAPQETAEKFTLRLREMDVALNAFDTEMATHGEVTLYKNFTLHARDRIPEAFMMESQKVTEAAYAFSVDWVPAYFPEKTMGILWAGCTITFDEHPFPVFTIRRAFEKKDRFLKLYGRTELLAHESCHVARTPIDDYVFEELFAYAISESRFRRWVGNAFQTDMDAILFIAPLMLLSVFQFALIFFAPEFLENSLLWFAMVFAAIVFPVYIIFRSCALRRIYNRALTFLKAQNITKPEAVLFRCTQTEIQRLGRISSHQQFLQEYETMEQTDPLRFQVIRKRFFPQNKE